MTGLGTLVNMAAILIGSGLGLLLKNGIPKRLQTTISSAADSVPSAWMPEPQIYRDAISQQKCKMTRSRMICAAGPDFIRG